MELFINKIFNIKSKYDFEDLALKVFDFQYKNNSVYNQFITNIRVDVDKIKSISNIPFLPVELFKYHKVICGDEIYETQFKSSGTTKNAQSSHFVKFTKIYVNSFLNTFRNFYGDPSNYCIIGLLPSYLERSDSSLIYMVKTLIEMSKCPFGGFYLNNYYDLAVKLERILKSDRQLILFGVTFALLDFARKFQIDLNDSVIIETGGMKGRGEELTRQELHEILKQSFNIKSVHSEYGMTELLSQAYCRTENVFCSPSWMRILIRDVNDPFNYMPQGKTGGINVIDLANLYSCSFIETKDLGKLSGEGFEVLGRFDNSDLRGCNLLAG